MERMKLSHVLGILFAGVVLIGMLTKKPDVAPSSADRDSMSVGFLQPGECMSGNKHNSRANDVISNTDWSRIEGSAAFSYSTKQLIGGLKVFDEMRRLGTTACPDLAPIYNKYLAAKNLPVPEVQQSPTSKATLERVQLKTGANIRREPSIRAPVTRIGQQGDILQQFGTANGWVQVGKDIPEGWIAESVLTHLSR